MTRSTNRCSRPAWSATGALICAVGATKYDRCEIGADVIERCAAVVCDDVVGSRAECGDLIRAAAAGRFDWAGAVEPARGARRHGAVRRAGVAPVLFETQGVALQDVAVRASPGSATATGSTSP